MIIGYDFFHEP